MKITLPAQEVLKQLFQENEADGLQTFFQQSCHGVMPVFQMVRFEEGDHPENIDGIAVLIDEEAHSLVEDIVIDLKEGELVLYGVHGCGDCGCEGHDHSHEEGGCCGHCDH